MAGRALTTIGFDADDTLWQNEQFFRLTEERFVALLGAHGEAAEISGKLLEAEARNLAFYGFGIKGFTLSMIETAIEVTRGDVPAAVIAEILSAGREMLAHPVETLPHVTDTLAALAGDYRLVLITKGDLFDQERKLAQSGLGDFFDGVEIVSDKSAATYERVFARHGDGPAKAMMVGNSLKSDILPALAVGAWAAYVPHELTWVLEHAAEPEGEGRYHKLADLAGVHPLVRKIGQDC
ncbi:HAD family hydrolase [Bosea caraganae]|uniref:HAD family hydrolase n=1 Tax=Bosea caraganae TaxID=2763117 RepID=A0A370L0Q3_9HYPH|nr:HAD family hydrolase [Bosea caraganae]RDJ20432.1 HAD family hydrolase [Bosea caraganae]RDJ29947.1 HAD family hydrolase [Bosea caraganae]